MPLEAEIAVRLSVEGNAMVAVERRERTAKKERRNMFS